MTSIALSAAGSSFGPPRVGVGVFILNASRQILVGQRLGSHGAGTIALPGGHFEFGESFEECSAREVAEETGLVLDEKAIEFGTAVSTVSEEKHYVTVFTQTRLPEGSPAPQLLEPHKCAGWYWASWEELKGMAERDGEAEVVTQGHGKPRLFAPLVEMFRTRRQYRPWSAEDDSAGKSA